jgi:hypothetical protein
MHLTPDELIDVAERTASGSAALHVRSCALCRSEADALAAALAAVSNVDVPEPPQFFWEELTAHVREGAAAGAPRRRARSSPAIGRLRWSVAVLSAAAAAILIAVYVTGPRELARLEPSAAAPAPVADFALQPFGADDDPSLALVSDLTQLVDPAAIVVTGWADHPGAVDEVVGNLSNGERVELQRILHEAMEKRDPS